MNESLAQRLQKDFEDKDYAETYVDEFLNASIATQIKVLREQRGMSQKDLADLAEMKQERISVLENVNYGSWSLKTLTRLAHALDVTLKVSFETYRTRISDIAGFSRLSLQRKARADELQELLADQRSAASNSKAFAELMVYVNKSNQFAESRSAGLEHDLATSDRFLDYGEHASRWGSMRAQAGVTK